MSIEVLFFTTSHVSLDSPTHIKMKQKTCIVGRLEYLLLYAPSCLKIGWVYYTAHRAVNLFCNGYCYTSVMISGYSLTSTQESIESYQIHGGGGTRVWYCTHAWSKKTHKRVFFFHKQVRHVSRGTKLTIFVKKGRFWKP